ncbi:MAG: PfkB family carbohydrate kinase [Planctomycetota bacterium]|nr:PfkB family carbohydrate kinase [Planctomycetota bacterium]
MPAPLITVTLHAAMDVIVRAARHPADAPDLPAELPAGKGVNVARILSLLGSDCTALALVGAPDIPAFASHLASLGPGRITPCLIPLPGPTRRNITTIDPARRAEHHERTQGPAVTPQALSILRAALAEVAAPGALVAFSGSLPPGFNPALLLDVVDLCRAARCRVIIDTSGPALLALRRTPLFLLKLNQDELAELAGAPLSDDAAFRAAARGLSVRQGGPADTIIATRGPAGALLISPELELAAHSDLAPRPILRTVGCGDALLAGFLHEHTRGSDIHAAFHRAVAVACAAALSPHPGMVTADDIHFAMRNTYVQTPPPRPHG